MSEEVKTLKSIEQKIKENNKALQDLDDQYANAGKAFKDAIANGDVAAQKGLKELREEMEKNKEQVISSGNKLAAELKIAEVEGVPADEFEKLLNDIREFFEKPVELLLDPTKLKEAFLGSLKDFLGRDFKEDFKKGITAIGSGISKIGGSLGDLAKGAFGKVTGVFDRIKDLAMDVLLLLGAVVGFQSFIKGWQKASEWFGENADFGDRLASGIATILQSFLGLSEETTIKIAKGFAAVFDEFEKFFDEFFAGVTVLAEGLFSGEKSQIMEGLQMIIDSFANVFMTGLDALLGLLGFDEAEKQRVMAPLITFKDNLLGFFTSLLDLGATLVDVFQGEASIGDLWDSFSTHIENFLGLVDNLIQSVAALFGLDDEWVSLRDSALSIIDTITGTLGDIYDFFVGIPQMMGDMIYAIKSGINETISPLPPIFDLSDDPRSFTIEAANPGASAQDVLNSIQEQKNLTEYEKEQLSTQAREQFRQGATAQAVVTNINNQILGTTPKPRTRPAHHEQLTVSP